ncbi:MAG: type II secretion system F family protein [Planctomycetes bacterium]|nr:type II secretion system F family protein [Planctomycetota bacterium]
MGVPLQLLLLVGGAVTLFVFLGVMLFSRRWETYEEKYLEQSERTLESIFLAIPPQQLFYLSALSMMFIFVAFYFMFGRVLLAGIFCLPGYFGPHALLAWFRKRRKEKFGQQLVDALDNMSNSLKAGYSLPQAFELIEREMEAPISQEVRILNRETRLGLPQEQALRNMYARCQSEDLDLVITAIVISRELGGNLTEVFENIAKVIRERFRIEGKIQALTSQGKLQGLVVSVMPIFLGFAINAVNPELMKPMYTTLPGWGVMILIAILLYVGYWFIKKITTIDV